ncbi:MAG TPA: MFS transporter [Anaerolineales bacterium]|jgi:DHA1 family tetracycline resistance protein-like MFS transporter|nr:MFS transporter [Anaerolineales bacterium]
MVFKRFDRRLFTILSIVFVQMAGAAMILPILPLFAERQFKMQPATVTLLVSAYFAAQFFAGPYLGQLSDQYGRVPLLVISQLGSAVSFFMLAAAGNPAMLFAARIVDGITGGNIIVAQAYITDVTPREKRTEALGYIFAVFGIGFIIGPAMGGVLSAWLGARAPFVIAGAAALITSGMSWWLLDETVERQPVGAGRTRRIRLSPPEVARNFPLVLILVVAFVGQFGLGMLQSTFALFSSAVLFRGYSEQATNLGVGLLLAVVGVGQFVTQVRLIGPLKRRFGDARLVILGTTIRSVGFVIFALIMTPWLGAIGGLFFAVGMGLMMPPLQSLATRTVDETIRGGVLGLYQSSVSLATILSTAIAGVIFSVQPTLPYWIGAALSLAVLIPAIVLLRLSTQGDLNWREKLASTD